VRRRAPPPPPDEESPWRGPSLVDIPIVAAIGLFAFSVFADLIWEFLFGFHLLG